MRTDAERRRHGTRRHPGAIACPPEGIPVGTGGATATITGLSAQQTSGYHMRFFVPLQDAYRLIDPTWQLGRPVPTGSFCRGGPDHRGPRGIDDVRAG
ncbi:hypothetical protein ACRAWC_22865 [Leifsonia sp. L25]|uniref:hypothetical protein n=1 Tax=Leifsonia sp. L25 TaxID=3423957 RepID=UPI003D693BD5